MKRNDNFVCSEISSSSSCCLLQLYQLEQLSQKPPGQQWLWGNCYFVGWIHRPEVQSLPGVMLGAQLHYVGRYISNDGFLRFPLLPFQEHEKRCWSVDFNLMDPKLLASGSDDAKGKRGMQYLRIMFPPCIGPYLFHACSFLLLLQSSCGQLILTIQWLALRLRLTSAVLNSAQPPDIIWPSVVQVRWKWKIFMCDLSGLLLL